MSIYRVTHVSCSTLAHVEAPLTRLLQQKKAIKEALLMHVSEERIAPVCQRGEFRSCQ